MSSHYALLSLSPGATPEQLRAAYLRLAKERHPDRAPPEQREAAKRAFQELATAYSVLSDPTLRRAYDASLASSTAPPPARPARAARASYPHTHPHQLAPTRRTSAPPRPEPDSPFPGFRIPPGGYPRPQPRPPRPTGTLDPHPHPHGLAHSRAASQPQPQPHELGGGVGADLDPLSGLDPLAGLLGGLALDARREADAGRRSSAFEHDGGAGGVPSWARTEEARGDEWRAAGGARTARREWREGRREANGEGFSFQGMEEVEQLPGGGVAWRGESVTVSFSSGYAPRYATQQHAYAPHDPFPPPPPRRAPSPAPLAFQPSPSPSHTQRHRASSFSHRAPSPALPPHGQPPSRRPPSPARALSPLHSPLALPPALAPPSRPRPPQQPHLALAGPQHPPRSARRTPSPARAAHLALAGQAQAQLALAAQAHTSPRSTPTAAAVVGRQRRMSAGGAGGVRAPESPLFG
ncbi:hypothetical protein JCM9279_007313 [Rhodotorula babjevae]